MHDDLATDEHPPSRRQNALVQLGILVRHGVVVVPADGVEGRSAERAGKQRVDVAFLASRRGNERRRRRAGCRARRRARAGTSLRTRAPPRCPRPSRRARLPLADVVGRVASVERPMRTIPPDASAITAFIAGAWSRRELMYSDRRPGRRVRSSPASVRSGPCSCRRRRGPHPTCRVVLSRRRPSRLTRRCGAPR